MEPIAKTNPWFDQIIIRQLVEEDLPALEWDGEYQHFRRLYAEAYQRAMRGNNILWVAEHPPRGLIGQIFIQLKCVRSELADGNSRAYMYAFRVRHDYRKQGLGTRLITHVENDLIQRKFKVLTLNVAKVNSAAIRLYQRLGFLITAPEPGCWSYIDHNGDQHNVIEPAWRMEKALNT